MSIQNKLKYEILEFWTFCDRFQTLQISPTKGADDDTSHPSTASNAAPDSSFHILPRGALLSLHGLGQGMAVGLADTAASTWLMAAAAGVTGSMDSASTSARLLGCHQSTRVVVVFCVVVTFVMAMGNYSSYLFYIIKVFLFGDFSTLTFILNKFLVSICRIRFRKT